MRVAVLGAGGFIGSHLVERLIDHPDVEIRAVDITDEKLAGIDGDNMQFEKVDIGDDDSVLDQLVRGADVVIDLVAYANPSLYVESPLEVFELNFAKNLEIVRMCVNHGTRLIQFSTSEIYGHPTGDSYREDDSTLNMGPIVKQRWIYAASKQLLERVIHAHGLKGDLEYTIFRPFNVIGPRLDYLVPPGSTGGPRVFAHFMSALLTGGPMQLVNGGWVRRSFTHIDDAIEGVIATLDHPEAINHAYNLGNPGNEITIKGLAALMKEQYSEVTGIES